jgi:protoporphyrinogen oxidase
MPRLAASPVLELGGYPGRVCIVGAGVAGLLIAMILKYLKIDFDIVEASDRVGGRCFTYKFPGVSKHNYYDVGAMRIPDIETMNS